jgi:hypothetical protein
VGIGLNSVHLLGKILPELGTLTGRKVLTLGVQDCAFRHDELIQFLNRHAISCKPVPEPHIRLTTGFKWVPESKRYKYGQFIHQSTFLRALGFDEENIHSLDYSPYEGATIVHDLNVPVEERWSSVFDLIFDGGTLEHVFSIKDVLLNVSRMCALDGLVVHMTPVDLLNHGFINVNAELFYDFYLANGFEKVDLAYICCPSNHNLVDRYYLRFEPTQLTHSMSPFFETYAFGVFRKLRELPPRIPEQGYYERLWGNPKPTREGNSSSIQSISNLIARTLIDRWFWTASLARGYRVMRRAEKVPL